MSFAPRLWASTGSADRPMILVLRLSNSGFIRAIVPSSVVQTGVKSFGCENRIAHWSPIHSWKSMGPCVVLALKFGAVSLIRRDMVGLQGVGGARVGLTKTGVNREDMLPPWLQSSGN